MKQIKQKLLIDMIAFTLHINEGKRMPLLNRLNDPAFYKSYRRQVLRTHGRYKNNYIFRIHKSETIDLSVYPINTADRFLRVQYNPAKLTKIGRKKLRVFFQQLLGHEITKTIYFKATVTRIDVTLDVYDMKPRSPYIHKDKVQNSALYRDINGKVMSQRIGSDDSRTLITLYDKDCEQTSKHKAITDPNRQRIEIRMRDLRCTMYELADYDLASEFKDIQFFSKSFLTDESLSPEFRNDAFNNGISTALSNLIPEMRRRYLRQLSNHRVYPISLDLNFVDAHKEALKSLVHKQYRERFI